ncbi:hypothetical protein FXO38_13314 [Capsicum annuum]|nr:hypothetical protein FXO38_13314 [Capsicum annuum]
MAVARNSVAEPSTTTAAPGNTPTLAGTIEIDHNHPLCLHPNDTLGNSLISIQLTGIENYALWSRSMALSLIGKNKIGFVDGRYPKNHFDELVHNQWERVNVVVLSWIMNSTRKDLLSSIIYASNAHNVWIDLRKGLNERYSQCRSRILFMTAIPSISKVYSMIVDTLDEAALFTHKPGYNGKGGYLSPSGSGGIMIALTSPTISDRWIIEFGATNHMVSNPDMMYSYHKMPQSSQSQDLYTGMVLGIGKEDKRIYILPNASTKHTSVNRYANNVKLLSDSSVLWHKRISHEPIESTLVDHSVLFFSFPSILSSTSYPISHVLEHGPVPSPSAPTHPCASYCYPPLLRKSTRHKKPSIWIHDFVTTKPVSANVSSKDPSWVEAMKLEIAALEKNHTWPIVDLPPGKVPISCRWVYKVKYKANGEVERYKDTLVAKGYSQQAGVDYSDTFSPVAKMVIVRSLIAFASFRQWLIFQMDVHNAFLYGDLSEEVYMHIPDGCFNDANNRSRIILTTQNLEVSNYTRFHSDPLQFRMFNDDESPELLRKKVFGEESFSPLLTNIGQQIAKKCVQLPLSVILVAGILAEMEKKEECWEQLANNFFPHIHKDARAIVEQSYQILSYNLKSCLLYFGAFLFQS